jgi:hypothetical protein
MLVDYSQQKTRIYYQDQPDRLPMCPLTIHALLHIADSIKALGPVWAYWAFPMERYCGTLQRAIQNRRFPYASASRFVIETAQLDQIANFYDVAEVLALRLTRSLAGRFSHPNCTCVSIADLRFHLSILHARSVVHTPSTTLPKSARRDSHDGYSSRSRNSI